MIFTPCCPSAGPTGGAGVAFIETQFWFRPIRCRRDPINDLLNLFFAKRGRVLARSDKTRNPRSVLHNVPSAVAGAALLGGFHFHENVAGIKHFLRSDALTAAHFDNFLRRDEDVVDLVIQIESLHTASQAFGDFALKSRIGMNDVPTFGHELCASGYSEVAEYPV